MRRSLASALGIEIDRVSIKGKTNEGVDAVGRGEAIAAHAIALVRAISRTTQNLESVFAFQIPIPNSEFTILE